jgi:hypothetical protein
MGRKKRGHRRGAGKKEEPATGVSEERSHSDKTRVRHLLRMSSEDVPAAAAAAAAAAAEGDDARDASMGDYDVYVEATGSQRQQESITTYRPGSQRGRESISESELSRLMTDQWTFTEMVTFFQRVRWSPELLQVAENSLFQRVRSHRWEEDSSVLVYQVP